VECVADHDEAERAGAGLEILGAADTPAHVAYPQVARFAAPGLDHLRLEVHGQDLREPGRDRQRHAAGPAGEVDRPRTGGRNPRLLQDGGHHGRRIGQPVADIVLRDARERVASVSV
jgi:hypothetical protein